MRAGASPYDKWRVTVFPSRTAQQLAYIAIEIEQAEKRSASLRDARNYEMRRAADEGMSVREIGRWARMTSPGSVHKILKDTE